MTIDTGQSLLSNSILDAFPMEICVIDQDGSIAWKSHSWTGSFSHFTDLIEDVTQSDPELSTPVVAALEDIINGTRNHFSAIFPLKVRQEERWFRLIARRADDHNVYLFREDITQLKMAAVQSVEGLQDVAVLKDELAHFVYVVSHDLQEPLRMVTSYTQLLGKRYKDRLDADAEEFISYTIDGATRMQEMLKDLLIYSRVNTHGRTFEPTDCNKVVEQAIFNLRMPIEMASARIQRSHLPVVMGDNLQLSQLFQHLIGNALKFKGDNLPEIKINAEKREADWIFSVEDNGIGIGEEFYDRVFAIFQRLHARQKYPGTGIGLAICKKIVERHRGEIWVESIPGKGSVFKFTLPFMLNLDISNTDTHNV
jgi:light-regulated signal transduction histidine kinase (bacteriophytochrome)